MCMKLMVFSYGVEACKDFRFSAVFSPLLLYILTFLRDVFRAVEGKAKSSH